MSEPAQHRRGPIIEIANRPDLRGAVKNMLSKQGYRVTEVRDPGDSVDLEIDKPEDPENTRVVVTVTASTADEGTVGLALACLGEYRERHSTPHARAWVIAKDFSAGAWYAAQICPDITLKWHQVELSSVDATGFTVHRHTGI
jgi:hypothetical protein